ncbi:MAG: HEAT repeat domain-containing protein [Verrucomicrobiia bacterium]|jgi:aminopeptidase N
MEKVTSNLERVPLAVATAAAVLLSVMAGCSKKESQEAPMPPPSVTTLPATQPLPALPPPATTSVAPAASASAADTNQASGDDQSPAELAAQVKQLETDYQNTPDFQKRVAIIYELSANDDGKDVVDSLARLFLSEKDQELKIELVNSLTDVDGQNDKKLAILSTALRTDQPKEVRMEAIDGMGDAQDKRGIQILQGFLNDPDEDVRQSAQDTIEQLQNVPEPSPPAP